MRINPVKIALKEGKLQLGCAFAQLRSPEVATVLGKAGLDWAFIDAEHGGFGIETIQDLCRASVSAGLVPIVRVADIQYDLVARALDCGAQGILLPRIESPEVLARAASWTKFPPVGVRGFGLAPPNVEYEKVTIPQVIEHMNANVMVVLQIETKVALERREELISIPGIDAVLIGPADLSISLGIPGEFEHQMMVDAIDAVRDTCLKHGVAPGIHTRTLALAQRWKARGLTFLSTGSDTSFLFEKVAETVAALR